MISPLLTLSRVEYRLLLIGLLFASNVSRAETWFITDGNQQPNIPAYVRLILLDAQQNLENLLSHELPAEPSQAPATIQHYLSSTAGKRLQNDLVQAQQGIADAWGLGIEKIPAVVVDRRYVIYGEADVAKAVEQINTFRSLSE